MSTKPLRTEWMRWAWPAADLPDYRRDDRRTVAYHEAGHAVLQCLLHLPMTGVEVYDQPKDGALGIVNMDMAHIKALATEVSDIEIPRSVLESAAVNLATMFVAGAMAELKLHGLEVTGWLRLDCRDFKNARIVLCEAFGWDRPLYYCQCLATTILTEHWEWVRVVANRLETDGKISPNEIWHLAPAVSMR